MGDSNESVARKTPRLSLAEGTALRWLRLKNHRKKVEQRLRRTFGGGGDEIDCLVRTITAKDGGKTSASSFELGERWWVCLGKSVNGGENHRQPC